MCANGSVRFARYCGKMYTCHLFRSVDSGLLNYKFWDLFLETKMLPILGGFIDTVSVCITFEVLCLEKVMQRFLRL